MNKLLWWTGLSLCVASLFTMIATGLVAWLEHVGRIEVDNVYNFQLTVIAVALGALIVGYIGSLILTSDMV